MVTFFLEWLYKFAFPPTAFESNRLYIPGTSAVSGSSLAFPPLLTCWGPPADLHLSQFPGKVQTRGWRLPRLLQSISFLTCDTDKLFCQGQLHLIP